MDLPMFNLPKHDIFPKVSHMKHVGSYSFIYFQKDGTENKKLPNMYLMSEVSSSKLLMDHICYTSGKKDFITSIEITRQDGTKVHICSSCYQVFDR
jgi:hypothetical protein